MSKIGVERFRKRLHQIGLAMLCALLIVAEPPARHALLYEVLEMIGFLLISIATLGRIWCNVYIAGQKGRALIRDGPYAIVRNPLYLFSFAGVLGVSVAARSLLLAAGTMALLAVLYYPVIRAEETRLAAAFGPEYADYCEQVPRLLPRLSGYWSRQRIEVDPTLVFRAMVDASVFMWVLILLEIAEGARGLELGGRSLLPALWQLPF